MKKIAIFVFAALMGCTTMQAQNRAKAGQPVNRLEKCTKVANRVADKLKLDDRTQEWFVPLYAAYQDTLIGIRRSCRMAKPAGNKKGQQAGLASLNDAEALQCVENSLKRDELTLKVKRDYYAQFKKKLTPQQLASIFCTSQARPGQRQRPQGKRPQGQRGFGYHHRGDGAGWQQNADFD